MPVFALPASPFFWALDCCACEAANACVCPACPSAPREDGTKPVPSVSALFSSSCVRAAVPCTRLDALCPSRLVRAEVSPPPVGVAPMVASLALPNCDSIMPFNEANAGELVTSRPPLRNSSDWAFRFRRMGDDSSNSCYPILACASAAGLGCGFGLFFPIIKSRYVIDFRRRPIGAVCAFQHFRNRA